MELSPILKVVQYSDFLSIKFNFHENNPVDETNYKERKICIAANPNRGEKQILGTIAYKLTQMAMEILFENECKPYRRADGDLATEYEKVKQAIAESVKDISHDFFEISISPTQLHIRKDAKEESIGRLVRILVEHEQGKKWLKDVFPTWFNFYVDKVIPKCREFIDKSHILKPRNAIRKINETLGEIMKLKNLIIVFENVNIVRTFISNEDKKIFVLRTQFTHVGMIKIIQEIFGRDYVEEFDKYFALSFENLMSQSQDILQAFQSDASDVLIVRVSRFVNNAQLQVFIDKIPKILQRKPKKKIIFVVHPNAEEEIKKILLKSNFDERHKLWDICEEKKDTILSLYDLHEDSKKRILSKDVIFQGMKITLNELIGTNRNLQELLKEDTLEQLFEEKEVFIGSKTYEHFNFQRACTSVNEEINIKTLINELKSSDVIFAIKGSEGLNDKEKLLQFFQEHMTDDSKNVDTLAGQIHLINSAKFEFNHKKLLLRNPHLDINIKKFCQFNREKKVCFIDVKRVQNKRVLVLKEFYNPSFYLNRKFKLLQVNWDVLKNWISELSEERFVLSKEAEVCLNLKKTGDNVQVTDCNQARKMFNDFIKMDIVGHWFHAEESDKIFWIDSYGSIKDLRSEIQYKLRKNKQLLSLIDENDIVKQLVHKKVLIIADDPGMGKSTTLTKLYDSPLIAKSHWIIRIDLEMHKEVIKKSQLSDFSTKRIINILQEMNNYLKDKLTEDLLESALTEPTFPKLLLLVFDGFDEIKDKADRNKIVFILKYLQKNTRSKIWVTTRFEHQNELEEKLCSLALEFEPIDDESRKTYMARYLKDRLKLTLDVDLGRLIFSEENEACSKIRKIYVEKFFDYISSIFGKDMAKYMGAPYQLNLMFEKCLNHCKKWIESKTWMQNDEELDFSFLGKEKIELLEKNSNWEFNEL